MQALLESVHNRSLINSRNTHLFTLSEQVQGRREGRGIIKGGLSEKLQVVKGKAERT